MDKTKNNSQTGSQVNTKTTRQAAEQLILQRLDQIYGVKTESAPKNVTSAAPTPAAKGNDRFESDVITTQSTSNSTSNSTPIPTNTAQAQTPTKQDSTYDNQLDKHSLYSQTYQQADTPTPDWQAYHSAWQNYYQKYYESYYVQQLRHQAARNRDEVDKAIKANKASLQAQPTQAVVASPTTIQPGAKLNPRDQALRELRAKLRAKMTDQAKKVRRSRHFWPLTASFIAVLIFLFLQYNRLLVGQVRAYITPAETTSSNVVVDPTVNVGVGPEPRLIIPKINVNVPVVYDIGNDNASQLEAMKRGVAHFAVPGASSHPGEIGNTPISGHSSNDVFEQGDYKFIFAQLDRLNNGDLIYADYKGKRYTYSVTKKEVVWPNEWEKLVYPTNKPILTLITCTPIGTTKQRLLVTAEQISPDPAQATKPAAPNINITKQAIPGESTSFFERLFGKK